ncbi:MAG TPA: hypothetical protein VGD10_05750 [Allosphingosinicella sp.]|uniref:hypothetical protein n=1 Tax=Allosphingosinicella sp. TaxID=2823234 RepID=UPI002ED8AE86
MRIATLPLLIAATAPLAGCAYLPLAPAVADIVASGRNQYVYTADELPKAASEACRSEAYRYGRFMSIDSVQLLSQTTARVHGTIQYTNGTRSFGCTFRNDGRIIDFDR